MTYNILKRTAILGVLSLLAALPVMAQSLDDPLLDQLIGSWVLRGQIAHRAVTHSVEARWVLAHQYVQIHETSRSRTPDGAPEYDAIVYIGWDPELKQYACLWLDSTGGNGLVGWALGHATADHNKLAFVFTDKGGEPSLHNTFTYDDGAHAWRWQIDNVDKGQLKPFADVTLTRK